MKIIYQDEYGEEIYRSQQDIPSSTIPNIGDTIVIDDEDWRVAERIFHPKQNTVVIEITQNLFRSQQKTAADTGRLAEMNRAIVELSKRQDSTEKKNRALTEQFVTVRKHINQRIQQDKKEK